MKGFLAMTGLVATLASAVLAEDCPSPRSLTPGQVEIVRFRLAPGVSRDTFLAAAAATMPALCRFEGFVGRTLSEAEDGSWMDHVQWESAALAQRAMEQSMTTEALLPFLQAIDPESLVLTYHKPVDLTQRP